MRVVCVVMWSLRMRQIERYRPISAQVRCRLTPAPARGAMPPRMDFAGPTSNSFISQRLRLHYVDWGNPDAPPLILQHGGRDHCRSWDWVARGTARRLACDRARPARPRRQRLVARRRLRHATPSSMTSRSWSISSGYDQVTIVAHSLGGNIATQLHRALSGESAQARQYRRPRPLARDASPIATPRAMPSALREWIDNRRKAAGRLPRRYPTIGRRLCADEGGERLPHRRPGAAPDHPWRQPQRGRHLELEVRQLPERLAADRSQARDARSAVGGDHLPDAAALRR